MTSYSLVVACLAVFSFLASATDTLSRPHVRLVDFDPKTQNLLFRTGIPRNATSAVALEELTSYFKLRAEQSNIPFPTDFDLIDINLLTKEQWDIDAEKEFFVSNPRVGIFIHWPLFGVTNETMLEACQKFDIPVDECNFNTAQPKDFSVEHRKKLALNLDTWLHDDLMNRVSQTFKMLHTPARKPQIIFAHCECGCDRTGEFFASYYMHFMKWGWTRAQQYNEGVPLRHTTYHNMVASQWYCYRLFYNGIYRDHSEDCGNCEDFRCFP